MKASENCFELIRHFEGCRLTAYPDPKTGGDPWTIGHGSTGPGIGPGVVWTQAQADARLVDDVAKREAMANNAITVEVTQGVFDAFVSAVFNIGAGSSARDGIIRLKTGAPSSCLRFLNQGNFSAARASLGRWISPGSNVEYGLRKRRTAEQGLWDGLDAASAIALGEAVKR